MTHPNKRKGDAYERAVRDYIRDQTGLTCERIPAGATDDLGDLWVPPPGPLLQCKDVGRIDLAGFTDEMRTQTANSGRALGFVVIKRRSRNVADSYLVTTLGDAIGAGLIGKAKSWL